MATTVKYSRYFTYIKPITNNKTVKSVAPYIFSLIMIIILVIFAIRPTISTILNLQKNLADSQQVLEGLNNKAQNLIEGKKNYNNLPPEVKVKINLAVPVKPDVTFVIASLNNSSKSIASVSALQIQPLVLIDTNQPKTNKLALDKVDFSYNTVGSFTNLLQVLQNINNASRLLQINNVTINKQTDSPTVLSITGNAYYLK
ncbi:MAG: hypothetical protein Q7R97_00400 [Candidatus Daviesbacteria bacterium]|nr:hypothetical protein [Candidatus Daviesbacteria bacterium]